MQRFQKLVLEKERLDTYTLKTVFDLFVKHLATGQRRDYNQIIKQIDTFINKRNNIKNSVYQITMDDLETILKQFKI